MLVEGLKGKGKMGQAMACINNQALSLLLGKQKFRYFPHARRCFAAHPAEALDLISRL